MIRVGEVLYHSQDPKVLRSVLKHVGKFVSSQWCCMYGGLQKERESMYLEINIQPCISWLLVTESRHLVTEYQERQVSTL